MSKEDKRDVNLEKLLEKLRSASDFTIPVEDPMQHWKCVECGFELSMTRRPGNCPYCNSVDDDIEGTNRVFLPRRAHWDSQSGGFTDDS